MPKPGDVYVVTHPRGYFGAVRVLRKVGRSNRYLAYCSTFLERKPPALSDPRIRRIQRGTHFYFDREPVFDFEAAVPMWVDGEPPRNCRLLGSLPPSGAEARRDSNLYTDWPGVTRDAWFEWRLRHERARFEAEMRAAAELQEREERAKLRSARPKAMMPESEFWALIALLDTETSANQRKRLAPLVRALAEKPQVAIRRFHERLVQLLHRLDTRERAGRIGTGAWTGNGARFSADGFLYARCTCVAQGRDFYRAVLRSPGRMPKGMEFEMLLSAAPDAYRRRTGRPFEYSAGLSFESRSNLSGWPAK